MKTLIAIAAFVAVLLYTGSLRVTLHPFHISMPDWASSLGWLLVIIGAILISTNEHNKAYEEGVNKGMDTAIELMQQAIDELPKGEK